MVAGLHDGLTELLGPDLGGPVTDGKEVLKLGGVTLESVDGAVMLSVFETVAHINFDLVLTSVSLHDVTLLATDQVLHRGSLRVVLKGGSTANLGCGWARNRVSVVEDKLISGALSEHALVPPEEATIGGGGDTLGSGLGGGEPVNIVDGVVMTLLEDGGLNGLDDTWGATFTLIEELEGTVVSTTNDDISILVVEHEGAQGGARVKGTFGSVRVVQVPDVRHPRHVGRHLLEAELGVGDTNAGLRVVGVPRDLGDSALDLVRVLEDHNGLGVDGLGEVLGLLAIEVLLEKIDLVVLADAPLGGVHQVGGRALEAKVGLTEHFLLILCDVEKLGVVELLWPSTDGMAHTAVICNDAFSVDLQGNG
jgi:hypothetical protein